MCGEIQIGLRRARLGPQACCLQCYVGELQLIVVRSLAKSGANLWRLARVCYLRSWGPASPMDGPVFGSVR